MTREMRPVLVEGRSLAVDAPALVDLHRLLAVEGQVVAEGVEHAAERHVADRHGDRLLRVDDVDSTRETVCRIHRDRAHAVVSEVLLHLCDQLARPAVLGDVDAQRVVDLGELVGEDGVDHDALDLDEAADVPVAAA